MTDTCVAFISNLLCDQKTAHRGSFIVFVLQEPSDSYRTLCWRLRRCFDFSLPLGEVQLLSIQYSSRHCVSPTRDKDLNRMLWVDKHRPKSLDSLDVHPDLTTRLGAMVRDREASGGGRAGIAQK